MENYSTIGMCKTPFAKKRVINHCGKNMHTAKKRSKNKTNFFSLEILLATLSSFFFRRKKRKRGCNKKKTDKKSSRREEGYNQKMCKKVLPLLILLMVAADLGKSQGTKFWRNKKFLTAGN